jgi:hypothetical protein
MRIPTLVLGIALGVSLGAVGCDSADAPRMAFCSINYGEGYAPLPFAVGVLNDGRNEGHIDRVDAKIHSVTLIPGPGLTAPPAEDFRYETFLFGEEQAGVDARPLPKGSAMTLPVDKTADVWCALRWTLPDDAPPMLAACSVSFVLSYQGQILLETPPQAVMLQSQPGILERMSAAPAPSKKHAVTMAGLLSGIAGERSPGFQGLLDHMASPER